jgi:formylglycine-generating enzyme required for sulfatase activity
VQLVDSDGYRLPTEAEWEYACRAGTKSHFNFGSVLNGDKANVDGNYPFGTTTKGTYLERTTRVGSYGENAFGLFDMHGNVWEWCEDVFDEQAYASRGGTTINPLVMSGSEYRVLRGGSWVNGPWFSRSANRSWLTPVTRYVLTGFRVVSVGVGVRTP